MRGLIFTLLILFSNVVFGQTLIERIDAQTQQLATEQASLAAFSDEALILEGERCNDEFRYFNLDPILMLITGGSVWVDYQNCGTKIDDLGAKMDNLFIFDSEFTMGKIEKAESYLSLSEIWLGQAYLYWLAYDDVQSEFFLDKSITYLNDAVILSNDAQVIYNEGVVLDGEIKGLLDTLELVPPIEDNPAVP